MDQKVKAKLTAVRTALLDDTKTGLREVGQAWHRQHVEGSGVKIDPDELSRRYAQHIEDLLNFPEEERLSALTAYSKGLRLVEGRTTRPQSRYVSGNKRIQSHIKHDNRKPPFRDFFDPIILSSPVTNFTPEFMIYIMSSFDLGKDLPFEQFSKISNNIVEFLTEPSNQRPFLDRNGVMNLSAILTTHARFLYRAEEATQVFIAEQPTSQVSEEEPSQEVEPDPEDDFEDPDYPEEDTLTFQKFRKNRKKL